MNFYSIVYNALLIPLAQVIIYFLKMFNPKLKEREENCSLSLDSLRKLNLQKRDNVVWFHSASMGEFEQAKPIIEKLKARNKDIKIVCSFFSPSGYKNQKNYEFADAVCYLPFDSIKNVRMFLDLVNPCLVVFVRYEIWRNYLEQIKKRQIKVMLIDATAPQSKSIVNPFFIRGFTRTNYSFFDYIFTVGEKHTEFFKELGVKSNIKTLTDTRFDRIIEKVSQNQAKPLVPRSIFNEDELVLIAGSSWEEDEELIYNSLKNLDLSYKEKLRLIIVPHEPTDEHILRLQTLFSDTLLFSKLLEITKKYDIAEVKKIVGKNTIIVDSIGKLLGLYSIADFAYIGGGFGAGIHSVTEPAGYGIPLSCGYRYKVSHDAVNLVELNALKIIEGKADFTKWLEELISDENKRNELGKIAKEYINNNAGATEKIVKNVDLFIC
ncbi:MAG TPA: glycosyltransferase N-terminal domain-containing protein [Candidatus Kapabacteria bacterium]|nr:glycosyltransferase N-terminal domain-containing protein [Candidatus Kapabacteria bacterium]